MPALQVSTRLRADANHQTARHERSADPSRGPGRLGHRRLDVGRPGREALGRRHRRQHRRGRQPDRHGPGLRHGQERGDRGPGPARPPRQGADRQQVWPDLGPPRGDPALHHGRRGRDAPTPSTTTCRRPPCAGASRTACAGCSTDVIDLLQIHWPDPAIATEEMFGEMLRLKQEGKVRWLGVCNFTLARSSQVAKAGGGHREPPAAIQPARPGDRGRGAALVPARAGRGHRLQPHGPRPADRQIRRRPPVPGQRPPGRHPLVHPRPGAPASWLLWRKARPIAAAHGVSLGNLAVAWTLAQPGVTAAIVGARDATQAQENARAASIHLSTDELRTLSDSVRLRGLVERLFSEALCHLAPAAGERSAGLPAGRGGRPPGRAAGPHPHPLPQTGEGERF